MNKLSVLFQQHASDLIRYVNRRFASQSEAEDIVQDAFHNLLKIENIDEIENPRAYLYQAAHNLALNRIRKQGYHEEYLSHPHLESDDRSPEVVAQSQSDLSAVDKHLESLPEKCRVAFVAHRVHGRSYQEIADELGVSVSSVEKYLMRAMKFLRESFED